MVVAYGMGLITTRNSHPINSLLSQLIGTARTTSDIIHLDNLICLCRRESLPIVVAGTTSTV